MSLTATQKPALGMENAQRFLTLAEDPACDYRAQMIRNAESAIRWVKANGGEVAAVEAMVRRFEAIEVEVAS